MCFCVIELKKRSCWIAQDIFLFLLWTSDTLPVQSSCFAPEMISFLRKAKIIFTPALETIISIHEDTYVESRIGVVEKIYCNIWGCNGKFDVYKLETYMYFSWDNGVKGSKGRREGGWRTSPAQIISHANHLSHRVELQCLRDLEDLPCGVNETGGSLPWVPPALDVPGEELMKMPTVTLGTLRRKWCSSGGPPWK